MNRENYVFLHEDGKWRVCIAGCTYDVSYTYETDAQWALRRELWMRAEDDYLFDKELRLIEEDNEL